MSLVERILYNANIITQDTKAPRVTALAIAGGRVVATGSDADILALADADSVLHNLGGRTVIPGLTDAHVHWQLTAESLQEVDLFEVPDKATALERIAARVAITPPGAWVRGWGWTQDIWPDRAFPTAADLDAVAPNNPVYLQAKSVHAAWANSAALSAAGITADTPDPLGGEIARDASGQPTGILLEAPAMSLVRDRIPRSSPEQLADWMVQAQDKALVRGLTGIHDFDNPGCLRALQIVRERGQLALRVLKNINKDFVPAALESGLRWGFGDDWLRLGGVKLFADGALGPRTAYMIEAYEGEPDNFGIVVTDKEEIADVVSRASAAGFPATVHAIGDRAVHDVLDVYEAVRREEAARGEPTSTRRHRIEHVQIIHPDDVKRLAELDIIASFQPVHATSDMDMSDSYWGARSRWAYNPRIQIDQGVVVAFGSDSPVDSFDPFVGIFAAVTRRRLDGTPGPDGWYPDARLTVEEALYSFTVGPAYAAGMEDRLGRLAPGFLADLVVIDRDILTIDPNDIAATQVHATMSGGLWRYGSV
jgi:predicted amidohydrolase YtcJ